MGVFLRYLKLMPNDPKLWQMTALHRRNRQQAPWAIWSLNGPYVLDWRIWGVDSSKWSQMTPDSARMLRYTGEAFWRLPGPFEAKMALRLGLVDLSVRIDDFRSGRSCPRTVSKLVRSGLGALFFPKISTSQSFLFSASHEDDARPVWSTWEPEKSQNPVDVKLLLKYLWN